MSVIYHAKKIMCNILQVKIVDDYYYLLFSSYGPLWTLRLLQVQEQLNEVLYV
jgi:hypothetical protein